MKGRDAILDADPARQARIAALTAQAWSAGLAKGSSKKPEPRPSQWAPVASDRYELWPTAEYAARSLGTSGETARRSIIRGSRCRERLLWRVGTTPPAPRRTGRPGVPIVSSAGERWESIDDATAALRVTRRIIEYACEKGKPVKGRVLSREASSAAPAEYVNRKAVAVVRVGDRRCFPKIWDAIKAQGGEKTPAEHNAFAYAMRMGKPYGGDLFVRATPEWIAALGITSGPLPTHQHGGTNGQLQGGSGRPDGQGEAAAA